MSDETTREPTPVRAKLKSERIQTVREEPTQRRQARHARRPRGDTASLEAGPQASQPHAEHGPATIAREAAGKSGPGEEDLERAKAQTGSP